MRNKIFIYLVLQIFICKMYSQIATKEAPVTFFDTARFSYETVHLKDIDIERILKEDFQEASDTTKVVALPVGYPIPVNISSQNSGIWDTLVDGSKIWRLKIISANAQSLMVYYKKFWLPKGAKFWVYSENKRDFYGPYKYQDNKEHRKFATPPIPGEILILEYYQPYFVNEDPLIKISHVGHIYDKNNSTIDQTKDFGDSKACHIDVMCPDAIPYCNQRRSVGMTLKLSNDGVTRIRSCSGALITNERRDLRPYFLTANHCVDADKNGTIDQSEEDAVDVLMVAFNYQSPTCSNPTEPNIFAFTIIGATVRANSQFGDFALLELDNRPPGNFNSYYSGFDNDNARPNSGALIHHPEQDIKKIAFYDKKPDRKNMFWEVKWSSGSVENGSSGAPLFNENKLIVGQQSSKDGNPCHDKLKAYCGRLDKTWDNGQHSSTRLKEWLNPNGSSSLWIQAYSGDEPCQTSWSFSNVNDLHTSATVDGMYFTGPAPGTRRYDGVYNASGTITASNNVVIQNGTSVEFHGNRVILGPGFRAVAGSRFRATANPCAGGCNTGVGKMTGLINDPYIFETNLTESKSHELDNDSLQMEFNDFTIYPNPTTGHFTLLMPPSNKLVHVPEIIITDLLGKIIHHERSRATEVKLNLSTHPKGIYFVRVQAGETIFTEKIVVQ